MSNIHETRSTSHFARFWSLWILCGSCVVSFVVFGHVWFLAVVLSSMPMQSIARPLVDGLCGSVVLPSMPMPMIARPLVDGLCGSVVLRVHLPSMPMPTLACRSCASTCSLWTDKKICSLPNFVLCSLSSSLEATFTEWRKRSWLERP